MITVYDLRRDTEHVAKVQRATLTTPNFGLEPTHGMFGSPEWWEALDSGKLPRRTLRGEIARVYMGSVNDWPEFEMRADDGTLSSWSQHANEPALAEYYRVGRPVELDYVLQRTRPASGMGPELKVVVAVRVGAAA